MTGYIVFGTCLVFFFGAVAFDTLKARRKSTKSSKQGKTIIDPNVVYSDVGPYPTVHWIGLDGEARICRDLGDRLSGYSHFDKSDLEALIKQGIVVPDDRFGLHEGFRVPVRKSSPKSVRVTAIKPETAVSGSIAIGLAPFSGPQLKRQTTPRPPAVELPKVEQQTIYTNGDNIYWIDCSRAYTVKATAVAEIEVSPTLVACEVRLIQSLLDKGEIRKSLDYVLATVNGVYRPVIKAKQGEVYTSNFYLYWVVEDGSVYSMKVTPPNPPVAYGCGLQTLQALLESGQVRRTSDYTLQVVNGVLQPVRKQEIENDAVYVSQKNELFWLDGIDGNCINRMSLNDAQSLNPSVHVTLYTHTNAKDRLQETLNEGKIRKSSDYILTEVNGVRRPAIKVYEYTGNNSDLNICWWNNGYAWYCLLASPENVIKSDITRGAFNKSDRFTPTDKFIIIDGKPRLRAGAVESEKEAVKKDLADIYARDGYIYWLDGDEVHCFRAAYPGDEPVSIAALTKQQFDTNISNGVFKKTDDYAFKVVNGVRQSVPTKVEVDENAVYYFSDLPGSLYFIDQGKVKRLNKHSQEIHFVMQDFSLPSDWLRHQLVNSGAIKSHEYVLQDVNGVRKPVHVNKIAPALDENAVYEFRGEQLFHLYWVDNGKICSKHPNGDTQSGVFTRFELEKDIASGELKKSEEYVLEVVDGKRRPVHLNVINERRAAEQDAVYELRTAGGPDRLDCLYWIEGDTIFCKSPDGDSCHQSRAFAKVGFEQAVANGTLKKSEDYFLEVVNGVRRPVVKKESLESLLDSNGVYVSKEHSSRLYWLDTELKWCYRRDDARHDKVHAAVSTYSIKRLKRLIANGQFKKSDNYVLGTVDGKRRPVKKVEQQVLDRNAVYQSTSDGYEGRRYWIDDGVRWSSPEYTSVKASMSVDGFEKLVKIGLFKKTDEYVLVEYRKDVGLNRMPVRKPTDEDAVYVIEHNRYYVDSGRVKYEIDGKIHTSSRFASAQALNGAVRSQTYIVAEVDGIRRPVKLVV